MFRRLVSLLSRFWRLRSPARATARDNVEQRLLATIDRFERALHRARQRGGVLDPLAVTARRLADRLERREIVEVDKRRLVALRRLAIRIHAERRTPHRAPHRVVDDDRQHRQFVHLRGVMHRDRVGEDVRPVAEDRDYLRIRLREFDAERRAGRWNGDAPPPPLPASVVDATSRRYLEAYRRVTGRELKV